MSGNQTYACCVCGTCIYVFMLIKKVYGHSRQHNVIHAWHKISTLNLYEHPVDVVDFVRDTCNIATADNSPATCSC